ncbi:hypothetical protein Slin15195_G053510 [Septoria linicola]|uniref:Uncharacterized protein n=1 Tax=Septoria linicola TaxID=215465 RepID=A0A9Q9AU45_9PEZI|nr:hypothetical protein Slin15195_G053510 [Septoria linicola]
MATQQQADTLDGINVGGHSLRKRPAPASTAAPAKAPKRQKTGAKKAATSKAAGKKAAGRKTPADPDASDEGQESEDPDDPGEGGAGTPNGDDPGMPNGAGDPDGGAEAAAEAERDANDRAQLLERVPIIEDLAQWLGFYERSVKPVFNHDREWETVISQHMLAEEAKGVVDVNRQSVRLTALRTIMIDLVQNAVLGACSDPDEFLKTEEWNTMRDNLAAQECVRALVEAYNQDPQVLEFFESGMISQVITRRLLEPQAPRTYLYTADFHR